MVQSYKSSRAFRVGPGSGLSLSKYFGSADKTFCNIKSNDFFLSWCRFVVLTAVTSVSEVIVIFLQLILFANAAAFIYSLLGLVSDCFWEGDSSQEISMRWRCVEKINHSRDSWLVLRTYKSSFHIYTAILQSFFYAYSAIVDSFVIISFFLEKYCIPQNYRWLTCYVCARLCQCFGQCGWYFRCNKPCSYNYTCTQRVLLLRSCAYLNSLGKFGFQA